MLKIFSLLVVAVAKDCKHGDWDEDLKSCKCHEGWGMSGITDTANFMAGVCDQYKCISDEKCRSHLEIPGATCPVEGWNCYCGWDYAIRRGGHGYETAQGKGGGACMGTMFTFSVWATEWVEHFMKHTWKAFLLAAVLLLPFGRKRMRCDHNLPSMWRSLGYLFGAADCHGECLAAESYSWSVLKDDLAWSLYVLDLAFWTYAFLVVSWAVTLFVWSVLLWAMVLLAFLGMMVAGVFATCCEGGGAGGADCSGCSCDCAGCDCFPVAAGPAPGSADFFYWGGPYPYDCGTCSGGGDCSACECGCCSWRCCCSCCFPIAWMLLVFPRSPENAWGGLLGYLFGTHPLTEPHRLYQGGSCFVEFFGMAWRQGRDLHDDERWREAVYEFLTSGPVEEDVGGAQPQPLLRADGKLCPVLAIGRNCHAIIIDRPFDQTQDSCVESSFNDYSENRCWICQDNQHTEFDLWMGCHHIFCSKCSSEMLRRNMPCPLCRRASTSVLRGSSLGPVPSEERPTLLSPSRSKRDAAAGKKLLQAPAQGAFRS